MFHRRDKIEVKGSGVMFDEFGRLISDGSNDYELLSDKCFIEQAGGVQERTGQDGTTYTYSFIVHLDEKRLPKKGDDVRITKADGTLTMEMKVQDAFYYPNIRKAKIWL